MKIERISENKIKCTLNREDLAEHNIVLTEFAYGSEKARAFFQELMHMAEDEVGFEAEDIPLMIEAVPVNKDCIVLFITKVSDPEELDTRFSRFTSSHSEDEEVYEDDEEDDEELQENEEVDDATNILDVVKSAVEGLSESIQDNAEKEFVPLNESAKKVGAEKKPVTKSRTAIYTFEQFDDVCNAAKYMQPLFQGDNTLYKDTVGSEYYLVLTSGKMKTDEFNRVCNVLSEYGKKKHNSYVLQAYFEEHYICVIRSNALKTLANLTRE